MVTEELMVWLDVRVKLVLSPAVTSPGPVIEKVGATVLGWMVALALVNAFPFWVDCRPTLNVSALSVELPAWVSVGMTICCVFDAPGLNVNDWFTTPE